MSRYTFDGSTGPASYVCRPFTAVAISIRGVPGSSDIPVRLAVWGAYLIGRWLAQYKFCSDTVFALVYDRYMVGYIEFTKAPVQLTLAGSSNDTNDQARIPDTASESHAEPDASIHASEDVALTSQLDDREQTSVGFRELPDQVFTKFELFANIYAQLAHVAAFPPGQRVDSSWRLSSSAFPRSQTVFAPEGSPSLVEYRQAADAFLKTAFRVIQRRIVHGLAIRIKIGEKLIAKGLIWYPPRSGS
ncbi:MAG: hypothetical protein Q9221_004078 [Calogaya cf. arnoldii]